MSHVRWLAPGVMCHVSCFLCVCFWTKWLSKLMEGLFVTFLSFCLSTSLNNVARYTGSWGSWKGLQPLVKAICCPSRSNGRPIMLCAKDPWLEEQSKTPGTSNTSTYQQLNTKGTGMTRWLHLVSLPPYEVSWLEAPGVDPADQGEAGVQTHVQVRAPVNTRHWGWGAACQGSYWLLKVLKLFLIIHTSFWPSQ